ncbi:hypothetical protein PR202_gb08857 [Eleusine coracana subsp. coracana]|uniref:Uncharacterized protein n=1 Tax=Eleusine coracana subsp. coracana TaxID=191504 RepID=A0AAV5EFS4_ELECO|nr:hypothetical protein PR202_gb08857 [Eleusine coracana subsp. coracana]
MEGGLWLLWATLAVSLLYYLTNLRRRCSGGGTGQKLPPGPKPLPLLGNLLDLRGDDLHHALARLARAHGPVMRLHLGPTTAVVISTPDAAMEAFTKHDRRFAARSVPDIARAFRFAERSMIWLPSSSSRWTTLRGILATHFSPRSLAAVRAVRERKVRELVGRIRERAGQEVDVGLALYGGLINLVSSAFFSVDMVDAGGTTTTESAEELRQLMKEVVASLAKPNVSDLFPFLGALDVQGWRRWATGKFEKIFGLLGAIIDRRLATSHGGGDFFDVLLELMSTGKISCDDVPGILFDVFAGGSDTISITVAWAMAELLRNPSVLAKVSAEVRDVLGGKQVIEEPDAERLPYLQAVVKEAMRLHPVAPLMVPHQVVEDGVEIGGYAVPKGCLIIFNSWQIMRDPAAWERPSEFIPERFMMDGMPDFWGKDFGFIPFGSGRRRCPGIPMVECVVPFILASLLHAFEWKLPAGVSADKLDISERFSTVNDLAVPLKAVPVVIIT